MLKDKKDILRKRLLAKRLELTENHRQTASAVIVQKCIDKLKDATSVAMYYPIKAEVDVLLLSTFAEQYNIKLSLPITGHLFAEWKPGDALEFVGNAPQPIARVVSQPEVIIVPLVGFDHNCNRLGYGGGFYDQALRKLPSSLKIGVAFAAQECVNLPMEAHDIALDMIITEKNLYENNK